MSHCTYVGEWLGRCRRHQVTGVTHCREHLTPRDEVKLRMLDGSGISRFAENAIKLARKLEEQACGLHGMGRRLV